MSTSEVKTISIQQLMELIKWNEIHIANWRSWIDLSVWDTKALDDFKEFALTLDYVVDSEYERFQENCKCDIDVSEDNRQDCKCEANRWCARLSARIAQDIYFND